MRRWSNGGGSPRITTKTKTRFAVALALSLAVLAGGCSDSAHEPSPLEEKDNDSEQVKNTPKATPTVPPLPEAATEKSVAGAEAFGRYYIETVMTSDGDEHIAKIEPYVAPNCDGCDADLRPAAGEYVEGGEFSIDDAGTEAHKSPGKEQWIASVLFERKPGTWLQHTPGAKPEKEELLRPIANLTMIYREGRWQVTEITFSL